MKRFSKPTLELLEHRTYLTNIAFGSPSIVTNQPGASIMLSGDFMGNGQQDLVVSSAGEEGGEITLLQPNGNGTYSSDPIYTSPVPALGMVDADFHNDGLLDIIADYGSTVVQLTNNGDGTFTPSTLSLEAPVITAVTVGDINGDGAPDLVFASPGQVDAILNSDGTFLGSEIPVPDASINGLSDVTSLALADVNHDGILDLVIGNNETTSQAGARHSTGTDAKRRSPQGGSTPPAGSLTVDLGVGDGTFKPSSTQAMPLPGIPTDILVAPLNGQHQQDLAIAESGSYAPGPIAEELHPSGARNSLNAIQFLLGHGDGSFTPQNVVPLQAAPLEMEVSDFNNDGYPDLAVACSDGTIQVLPGNADGTLGPAITGATVSPGDPLVGLTSADFSSDGLTDLVVADPINGNVYFIKNTTPPISTPDPTFGKAGKVTIPFTSDGVATDSQNRALIAGSATSANGNYNDFVLARYDTDGTLDFKTTADFGSDAHATGVSVEPDGNILVVGIVMDRHGNEHVAVAQFTSTGQLDTTFGNNGTEIGPVVTLNGGSYTFTAVMQRNGKILIADGLGTNFSITRYNSDMTPDTTFGIDGNVTTSFVIGNSTCTALMVQPDGKIVAAGISGTNFALARYNRDGTLDDTFGAGGQVTTGIAGLTGVSDLVYDLNPRFPGSITALGYIAGTDGGAPRPALIRYDANGARNRKFGVTGEVVAPPTGVSGQPGVVHPENLDQPTGGSAQPGAQRVVPVDLALDQIGRIFEAAATSLDRVTGIAPAAKTQSKHAQNALSRPTIPDAAPVSPFSARPTITTDDWLFDSTNAVDSVLHPLVASRSAA